jgi:16S rRNA G966 N2-methylase RsmD
MLANVPLGDYDLVLADPPYTGEDAEHYGTTMISRNRVMVALSRVAPGTHVVWLDQVLPMYRKDTWEVEAEIGIRRSTNHRYREAIVFSRLP